MIHDFKSVVICGAAQGCCGSRTLENLVVRWEYTLNRTLSPTTMQEVKVMLCLDQKVQFWIIPKNHIHKIPTWKSLWKHSGSHK